MNTPTTQYMPSAPLATEYRFPVAAGSVLSKPGSRVAAGDVIGRYRSMNVFASVSGTMGAIQSFPLVNGTQTEHVTILPDPDQSTATSTARERPRTLDGLIELSRDAALVGMGGSGFPLHAKLRVSQTTGVETLVVNAMQCEPANDADAALLSVGTRELATAFELLRSLLKPKQLILALPQDAKFRIVEAVEALRAVSQVHYLPTDAASGEERLLIQTLTGLEIPRNRWPTDMSVLCLNLATCHALGLVATGTQPVRRIVTVNGVNQWVYFGHPTHHLLGDIDPIYHGGRSGFLIDPSVSVGPTTTALQTIPASTPNPCIRCGRCNTACPVDLKPQELYWYGAANRWDDLGALGDRELAACVECGACDAVCPSHLPLVATFRTGKADRARKTAAAELAQAAKSRFERHERRHARAATSDAERRAQRLRRRAARSTSTAESTPSTSESEG